MATFINESLGNSPSLRLVQKKNRPEKFSFIITPKLNVLAVYWSVKCLAEAQQQNRQLQSVILFKQMQ